MLAFGPTGRPEPWTRLVPAARVMATAAAAWGLVTLAGLPAEAYRAGRQEPQGEYHLMLLLDVSPSMLLQDAGPTGKQSRRQRAADLLRSFFRRVDIERYRVSVIAVYNGARPVVVDTRDADVVDNILDDLPLYFAFDAGPTRLADGIEEAARIARPWKPRSTVLLIVTDGDTVPITRVPKLPASVRSALIVGVGDPNRGQFIDGRMSRQDRSRLRHLAIRLDGQYHDGQSKHIPSQLVAEVTGGLWQRDADRWTRRELALAAVAGGSAVLALLPALLVWVGTRWRPGRRPDTDRSTTMPESVESRNKRRAGRRSASAFAAAVATKQDFGKGLS
ncbi:MAG: VWA domain-containing protein [Planctomycetes bacterium]|nr:VWA domain-containing protein [Planctomycetota bacterium]